MKRILYILLFLSALSSPLLANNTKKVSVENSKAAQEMFTKVFNMVYGPQGSTLSYKVNIVGLYKTEGTIIIKGKKQHFWDQKGAAWNDGVNTYVVNKKKHEVYIYDSNDEKRDKYMSKFKFNAKDFTYSYTTQGEYYLITAKVINASFFSIRSFTLQVHKDNLYPVSLKIKMGFIRTTVQISNFRAGKIADSNFIFPKDQYKSYPVIDKR